MLPDRESLGYISGRRAPSESREWTPQEWERTLQLTIRSLPLKLLNETKLESKSSPVSSPPNFTGSLTNGHPLSHLGSWTPGWLWPPIAEAVSDPWVHWRSWASNAATSSLANQIPLDPLAGESVRMLGFFRDFYGYSWRKKWVWPACNHPDFFIMGNAYEMHWNATFHGMGCYADGWIVSKFCSSKWG